MEGLGIFFQNAPRCADPITRLCYIESLRIHTIYPITFSVPKFIVLNENAH